MDIKFVIDVEDINEKNGVMGEAFFKYLKNVSKNKTPLVFKCVKESGYWKGTMYECAIPASKFSNFYLPAKGDANPEGTEAYLSLSVNVLPYFLTAGTAFAFKDNEIDIKRDKFKARLSYDSSTEEVQAQLEEFLGVIENDIESPSITWVTDGSTALSRYLENLSSNPEASLYVTKDSITLMDDSFVFRTRNEEDFETTGEDLYINMYVANKILEYLEYCKSVKVSVANNLFIQGLDENGAEVVKNISSVFEATSENPSDEDLKSIEPVEDAIEAEVDLTELVSTFDEYTTDIRGIVSTKYFEVKLYKNGNGLSFELTTSATDASTSKVNLNVGEVAEEEPSDEVFTKYAIALPLKSIKNIASGNQSLKFVYDETEDSAVMLKSGENVMLTGKLL